jgi:hypothetical protein
MSQDAGAGEGLRLRRGGARGSAGAGGATGASTGLARRANATLEDDAPLLSLETDSAGEEDRLSSDSDPGELDQEELLRAAGRRRRRRGQGGAGVAGEGARARDVLGDEEDEENVTDATGLTGSLGGGPPSGEAAEALESESATGSASASGSASGSTSASPTGRGGASPPTGHPGRVRFEEFEEPLSERQQALESQLAFWGNSFVMFSTIGTGLYVSSMVFGVDFERFLGMVMLGGLGMLAARPRYNPAMSASIEHHMSEAEIETIRNFVQRRVDMRVGDPMQRDEYLGSLKRASYSGLDLPRRRGRDRDRQESYDSYQARRPQSYYPTPEPFESYVGLGGQEDDEPNFF